MLQSLAIQVAAPPAAASQAIEWKELKSSGGLLSVYRAQVPGGWLVYVSNGYHHHGGVAFYPDPNHLWAGDSDS